MDTKDLVEDMHKKICENIKIIQKRKLSVAFRDNLWYIFDSRGNVASSNTLIEAIKKV